MIRIDGSLFFGAVSYTSTTLHRMKEKDPTLTHLLIVAKPINFIDVAGAEMLVQEAKYWLESARQWLVFVWTHFQTFQSYE
ncbi:sulfate permease family protein [Candidatus Thiomargarita nelsonii]|uniref:Sulfate permease family protein n=1 Tax=Candidatus Thiomargarita nelsonii TaxID=1003181 RepID=A0A176RZN7_9GAMM|nr:sulfate permease family protein [Candidatus Thiomargarita nelsonii]